jgi:hypothetical protein
VGTAAGMSELASDHDKSPEGPQADPPEPVAPAPSPESPSSTGVVAGGPDEAEPAPPGERGTGSDR